MAEERKPLAYVGFVIDRGVPFDGVQKAVDFFDGVGVLDYSALAVTRPEWFDRNENGELVGVHQNTVSMQAFVAYWEGLGAKVTPISETEAAEIRKALQSGKPIDPKYLKAALDTRKVAGGVPKEPAKPKGFEDDSSAQSVKKKGVK